MLYALNMVCDRTMELTRWNMRYSKIYPLLSRCDFIFCRLYFVFSVFYVLRSRSISSLSLYVLWF